MTLLSCRSLRPRCAGCSRSCLQLETGSREPNAGAPGGRGRSALASCSLVEAQRLEQAPFLVVAWFTERSRRSARERRDSSRPTKAQRFRRRPLSDSRDFARLLLRLTATGEGRFAAKQTGSSSSGSTAGSAAPTSRATTSGAGMRANWSSSIQLVANREPGRLPSASGRRAGPLDPRRRSPRRSSSADRVE